MSIGTRIKEIRKDNGLSQADFAKRIDISRSNLSNLEIERVSLTDRVLKRVFAPNLALMNLGYVMELEKCTPHLRKVIFL